MATYCECDKQNETKRNERKNRHCTVDSLSLFHLDEKTFDPIVDGFFLLLLYFTQ